MWEEEETRLRCFCPGRHAAALPAAGNWVVSGLFIPPAARLPRLPAASSRADGTLSPDWQTSSRPAVSQLSSSSSSSSSSSADDAVLSCLPAGLLSSRSADLFACSDGRVDFIERLKTLFFPPVVLIGAAKGAGSFSGKFFHGGSRQWWELTGKWRSWKREGKTSIIFSIKHSLTAAPVQNNVINIFQTDNFYMEQSSFSCFLFTMMWKEWKICRVATILSTITLRCWVKTSSTWSDYISHNAPHVEVQGTGKHLWQEGRSQLSQHNQWAELFISLDSFTQYYNTNK